MGCGSWAMTRTCSSARPDENCADGADAGAGSGTAPYSVPPATTPYSAAPVMTTNVRRAVSTFAPDAWLRFLLVSWDMINSHLGRACPRFVYCDLRVRTDRQDRCTRDSEPCIRVIFRRTPEPPAARGAPCQPASVPTNSRSRGPAQLAATGSWESARCSSRPA